MVHTAPEMVHTHGEVLDDELHGWSPRACPRPAAGLAPGNHLVSYARAVVTPVDILPNDLECTSPKES